MWTYLPVLNTCIQILATVLLGVAGGASGVLEAKTMVPAAVTLVFYVALPALVVRGIGIGVDFYSEAFLWNYIGAFLVLRALALVISVGSVAIAAERDARQRVGIGHVAILWLTLTWISTVIFGIPIMTSVLDSPAKGAFYGLLAGVSSFIFQLPIMLLVLECHTLEQEHIRSLPRKPQAAPDLNGEHQAVPNLDGEHFALQDLGAGNQREDAESQSEPINRCALWCTFAGQKDVWLRVGRKVLRNPVLWAIFGGFALSLSTVGPCYLRPSSDDFVEGLGWIDATLGWLGNVVSPVSLFTMGVWMHSQGRSLVRIGWLQLVLCMLWKLLVAPLLMIGLAHALALSDEAGRAAVLIAGLPISQASFALGEQFHIGQALLSANVAVGTALMLPTVILWNVVLDAWDQFPV